MFVIMSVLLVSIDGDSGLLSSMIDSSMLNIGIRLVNMVVWVGLRRWMFCEY